MPEPPAAIAARPAPPRPSPATARRPRRRTWAVVLVIVAAGVGVGAWWLAGRRPAPSLRAVELLIAADRYADAAREAERVAARTPNDPRAWLALGRARAGMNDLIGCAEALERVPAWSARKTEALYRAGLALKAAGRGRDAERALRDCIARDPEGQGAAMDARTELLKLLALEGRADAFKELLWETYDVMPPPERLVVLTARLRLEMEQAKPETDIAALQKLVDADPGDALARAGLAAAQGRAHQVTAARANFARALAERPDDVEVRERYLDLLHALGDLPGLTAILEGRTEAAEGRPRTWKYLGLLAEKAGRDDEAARAFARAAELDPSDPEYPHRLSLLLYRKGRKAEAEALAAERARLRAARSALRTAWNEFADAFESRPPRVTRDHLLGMARACDACRWRREAAAFYREVLRTAPDDPEARAGLEAMTSPVPA